MKNKVLLWISIAANILLVCGWVVTVLWYGKIIEKNTETIDKNTTAIEKNYELWLDQMEINGKLLNHLDND